MKYDLNRIAELLEKEKWTWAKTMPSIPHEYIVRDNCQMGEENFLMIVHAQRELGTPEKWGYNTLPYLYIDGYKYWTMGDTSEKTTIINRQKVFAEFDNIEMKADDFVPYGYVSKLYFRLYHLVLNRYVYEVGCGTGSSIRPFSFEVDKYIGIDPSKKAIKRFKERFPEYSDKLYSMSFEESVYYWSKGCFLIIATFGTASYLMEPYLKILDNSGKDYILMFYKEGKCPEEYRNTHYFHYTINDIHRILPSAQVLPFHNCYVASNMNYHEYEIKRIIKWEQSHLELLFEPDSSSIEMNLPYKDIFTGQMELIMKKGNALLRQYRTYIDYPTLNIDYTSVAKEYERFAEQFNKIFPFVLDSSKHEMSKIFSSVKKRVAFFRSLGR